MLSASVCLHECYSYISTDGQLFLFTAHLENNPPLQVTEHLFLHGRPVNNMGARVWTPHQRKAIKMSSSKRVISLWSGPAECIHADKMKCREGEREKSPYTYIIFQYFKDLFFFTILTVDLLCSPSLSSLADTTFHHNSVSICQFQAIITSL